MFQRCVRIEIGRGALQISTNNLIVSIVDDELDITELLRDAICGSIDGISVFTFNDPIIALEHFADNKQYYALVISDLRMPSINGLELLKRINSSSTNVRTIVIRDYEIWFLFIRAIIEFSILSSFTGFNRTSIFFPSKIGFFEISLCKFSWAVMNKMGAKGNLSKI